MFERFTDGARRVVVLAQEEARLLSHNYIGTEHLLLGLIHEGEGVAAKALEGLGVSLEAVRERVEETIGEGQSEPAEHVPFTPRSKKVLELSLRESLQLGHSYIGTEHILLGLVREGEGVAAQVLQTLGADVDRVRRAVSRLLPGTMGASAGLRVPRVMSESTWLLERLTDAALAGLLAARAEARRLGLDTVEVGTLFVGLLAVETGAAARVLGRLVSLDRIRAGLGSPPAEGSADEEAAEAAGMKLSNDAQRGIVEASSGQHAVGTGHLVCALLGHDAVTALLRAGGADVAAIRRAAAPLCGEGGVP